jgi:hypothetical protein
MYQFYQSINPFRLTTENFYRDTFPTEKNHHLQTKKKKKNIFNNVIIIYSQ